MAAVSDEHDRSAALAREALLLGALYAVKHLHFKILLPEPFRRCKTGQPPHQPHVMRAKSGTHDVILLLGPQHLPPKLEIVFVDILLASKRDLGRLVVCPFDQSYRRPQRQKLRQVILCSMEIRLQAYTNGGM